MKIRVLVVILILFILGSTKTDNAQTVEAQVDSSRLKEEAMSLLKSLHDNPGTGFQVDSSKFVPAKGYSDNISDVPTMAEINNLFYLATIAKRDPFVVAGLISTKMDAALPALEEFLFTPVEKTKNIPELKNRNADKHFAIYALELIGTPNSKKLLLKAGQKHTDKEVRAFSIKSLAFNLYDRIKSDSLAQDPEILHTLLMSLSDTSFVKVCGARIDEIAKKGIKNWTGVDYKTLLGQQKNNFSTAADAEDWWRNNAGNITWSRGKKHFTINR